MFNLFVRCILGQRPQIKRHFHALLAVSAVLLIASGCTQEMQNKISRGIQNWTGTDGVLDVLSEGRVVYRFIGIDKMSTAQATGERDVSRPYRFGYGVLDVNQNYQQDTGEKRIYFEVSDYSTSYVFYENPRPDQGGIGIMPQATPAASPTPSQGGASAIPGGPAVPPANH